MSHGNKQCSHDNDDDDDDDDDDNANNFDATWDNP